VSRPKWGRGPKTTETEPPASSSPEYPQLQWGRGPKTTETSAAVSARMAVDAASMGPWPKGHGDLDRELGGAGKWAASMGPWPKGHGDEPGRNCGGGGEPASMGPWPKGHGDSYCCNLFSFQRPMPAVASAWMSRIVWGWRAQRKKGEMPRCKEGIAYFITFPSGHWRPKSPPSLQPL
jgi:hypothetical protein